MVKVEKANIEIGKHKIYWRLGSMPKCDCWFSKIIPFVICPHVRFIASERNKGNEELFFKSEGGKL